jgi:hypothetical protein
MRPSLSHYRTGAHLAYTAGWPASISRLGILTHPSDAGRQAQLQLGLDLTTVNADGTVALPMPTLVVLDASYKVRWIGVHPDYSTAANHSRFSRPSTTSACDQGRHHRHG